MSIFDLALYGFALYGIYGLMVKFKMWTPFLQLMRGFVQELKKANKHD
jgi:hypothetical protein